MECSICSYKASKGWLLKRHQETSKKCMQIKTEQELHIKYIGQIELLKIQLKKQEEQLNKLKIENFKLKTNFNVPYDFIILHKNDIDLTHFKEFEDFEQIITDIIHFIYFKEDSENGTRIKKCGIKIIDKQCSILNNEEWTVVPFENIVDELWEHLMKPLFKEVKKKWCSYGHHKTFHRILYKLFQ